MGTNESNAKQSVPTLVRGYTFGLGVVAAFFVFGAVSIYSTADSPTVGESSRWAFVLAARLSVTVAALCALVAFLRARESAFAKPATTAFNILLALYFPIGTAAAAYWWYAIRPREQDPHAA